ncbi:MAG TPA: HPF/RaiA family ribosome-associated protein [Actinomycetota bacterium]|nr:HPF/RaiA family ribosome-associated protein [Actinomycetota bacterium]
MEITVHSQHGHLPESLQALAASKMEVLTKYLSTIAKIDLEVDKDGHSSYLIRVAVATTGPVFRSRVVAEDPMSGIDVAVERLSRRLKEFKRMRSGRPLHAKPAGRALPVAQVPTGEEGILDSGPESG